MDVGREGQEITPSACLNAGLSHSRHDSISDPSFCPGLRESRDEEGNIGSTVWKDEVSVDFRGVIPFW